LCFVFVLRSCCDAGSEIEREDPRGIVLVVPFNDAADHFIASHELVCAVGHVRLLHRLDGSHTHWRQVLIDAVFDGVWVGLPVTTRFKNIFEGTCSSTTEVNLMSAV
jgi:hypothetical protein